MPEYMDRTAISAIEDDLHTGLDREAAALVVAQSDNQNPAAGEVEVMLEACRRNNAADVLDTPDQDEGEMFVAVRQAAIPAAEKRGRLLLEDVGVSLPRLLELVAGIERIGVDRDEIFPLATGAYSDSVGFAVMDGLLEVTPADGSRTRPACPQLRSPAATGRSVKVCLSIAGEGRRDLLVGQFAARSGRDLSGFACSRVRVQVSRIPGWLPLVFGRVVADCS